MNVLDWILLAIRWFHLLSAVAWVGGGMFWILVLRPALGRSDDTGGATRRCHLTYEFATDEMAQITLEYRLAYFPTTIFVDKAGRLFRTEISTLDAEKITRIVRDMS